MGSPPNLNPKLHRKVSVHYVVCRPEVDPGGCGEGWFLGLLELPGEDSLRLFGLLGGSPPADGKWVLAASASGVSARHQARSCGTTAPSGARWRFWSCSLHQWALRALPTPMKRRRKAQLESPHGRTRCWEGPGGGWKDKGLNGLHAHLVGNLRIRFGPRGRSHPLSASFGHRTIASLPPLVSALDVLSGRCQHWLLIGAPSGAAAQSHCLLMLRNLERISAVSSPDDI